MCEKKVTIVVRNPRIGRLVLEKTSIVHAAKYVSKRHIQILKNNADQIDEMASEKFPKAKTLGAKYVGRRDVFGKVRAK